MKRAGFVKVLGMLTIFWLVVCSGCSGPGNNGDDPTDVDIGDVVQLDGEVDLDHGIDTGKDLPDIKPDEVAPVDIKEIKPDDVDIKQPDEVEEDVEVVVTNPCQYPCETEDDCKGVLEGEDECYEAICDWSEECADWNNEQGNPTASAFQCMLQKIGECCTDAECDDDSVCTANDRCDDHECKYDTPDPLPAKCCQNLVLLSLDFDDGAWPLDPGVFYVEDIKFPDDNVIISPVDSSCCGSTALYFGDPECRTYYTGSLVDCQPVEMIQCTPATEDEDCPEPNPTCSNSHCVPDVAPEPVHMRAVAPEINLPADALVAVQFKLCLDTEPSPSSNPLYDGLKLLAEKTNGDLIELYTTYELDGTTDSECVRVAADLSQFADQSINLIWEFHTVDNNLNTFEGIYLDDIMVATFCSTCTKKADCDDEDWCTVDSCVVFANGTFGSGFCVYDEAMPYCTTCGNIADCAGHGPHPLPSDAECWPASCVQVPGLTTEVNFCEWTPNPECCIPAELPPALYTEGFESGESGSWKADDPLGNNVSWHLKDGAGSPLGAAPDTFGLCFSNASCTSYDCGVNLCEGSIVSPAFQLDGIPENAFVKLTFDLSLSTEWDEGGFVPGTGIDTLMVEVVKEDATTVEVWNSDVVEGSTHGEWVPVWADLSAFKGEKISLKFTFSTADVSPPKNDFPGPKVDEIRVEAVCKQVCTKDTDCPATDCANPVCVDGKCATEPVAECCTEVVNADCDDGNDCTDDSCNLVTQICKHVFSGDPQCCTANPSVYGEAFGEAALKDMGWFLPETGDNCGDLFCDEDEETCATCPSDCNTCPVTWQLVDKDCFTPPNCLYFGNSENWNYNNNDEKAYGRVFSAPVMLPEYGTPVVSFHLKLDTEHSDVCKFFVKPNNLDRLLVYAQTAPAVDSTTWTPYQGGAPIWHSMDWAFKGSTATNQGGTCVVDWKTVEFGIDDSALAGKAIRFVFEFDSFDAAFNAYEGAYIDDFKIRTICNVAYDCFSGLECGESNPAAPDCTIESCQAIMPATGGTCVSVPNAGDPACCEQPVVDSAFYDFDPGCTLEGWSTDCNGLVCWQVHNSQNYTENGSCSLYFGNPLTMNFNNGGSPAKGTIISPEVDVTGLTQAEVSFWLWMDVEDPYWWLDNLTLEIDYVVLPDLGMPPMNDGFELWRSPCHSEEDTECSEIPPLTPCDELGCEVIPKKQWVLKTVLVDLTKVNWVAEPHIAVFKFTFDSVDENSNSSTGVYVDDFQVTELCQ